MENISNTSNETLTLMTMHAAKGLEFDNVFLAGWEEGFFQVKDQLKKQEIKVWRRKEDWHMLL